MGLLRIFFFFLLVVVPFLGSTLAGRGRRYLYYRPVSGRRPWSLLTTEASQIRYDQEKRLRDQLFRSSGYDARARPLINSTDAVDVAASFSLIHLLEVNEAQQYITFQGYLKMKWSDNRLKWDPSLHGEINALTVSSSDAWHPDLSLANTADPTKKFLLRDDPTPIMLNSDGNLVWTPRVQIDALCDFDVKYYPIDEHKCGVVVSPWLQDGSWINLTLWKLDDTDDMSNPFLLPNRNWNIATDLELPKDYYQPCCAEPWPVLRINFLLRRNAPVLNITFILTLLYTTSTLLLCFLLPIRSILRMIISITDGLILLAFLWFLTKTVPEASLGPAAIAQLTAAVLIESVIIMVFCGLLYHWSAKRTKVEVPHLALKSEMFKKLFTSPKNQTKHRRLRDSKQDLVDLMVGSDETQLITEEPNGESDEVVENGNGHLVNGNAADADANQTADKKDSTELDLARFMNRLGLIVFSLIFLVQTVVVLVL